MSATEVLTAVLVLVTGYYAWQNRRMVKEMAAARRVAVLPKLVLEWTMAAPDLGFPTVKNVGPGPALDVEIAIRLVPLPGNEDKEEVRQWIASVIAPGESKQFIPPQKEKGGSMRTPDLAATYASVELTGRYEDALGTEHKADDILSDIAEWRRITGEAIARWQDPDFAKRHAKETADQLSKKFKSAIDAIANGVNQ